MMRQLALFIAFCALVAAGCSNGSAAVSPTPRASAAASPAPAPNSAPVAFYTYRVVRSFPHDPQAFTQGLLVHNDYFCESTGLNGRSSLRRVEIESGKVVRKVSIPGQYFAEGLAELNGRLYQLTWQNNIGFIYDAESFRRLGEFRYDGEGWGLTADGKSLILSDGTDTIRFLNPKTFAVERTISVRDNGQPVADLNELEYIDGEIYANIWRTNSIVRIDPGDGRVLGYIDMTGILPDKERTGQEDVLNGIAFDPARKRLYVTGKKWPKLFEIEVVKQ